MTTALVLDMRQLRQNLEALDGVNPELAVRLRLPMGDDHLRVGADGGPELSVGRGWVPLALPMVHLATQVATASSGTRPLLLGAGGGRLLRGLLGREDLLGVDLWDRDPFLLRLVLSAGDLRGAIRGGRLRLWLGTDLLARLPWDPSASPLIVHPVAERVYQPEIAWVRVGASAPRALLATGELLVDDVADALSEWGFTVVPWELSRWSVEELEHAARVSEAVVAVAINYRPGLSETCERLGLPLICWEIDPKLGRLGRRQSGADSAHIFTFSRSSVTEFNRAGFRHVRYLPLATNPARRHPVPRAIHAEATPVSFVGNSMALQATAFKRAFVDACGRWAGVGAERAREGFDRVVIAQRSEERRFVVPAVLEEVLPGVRAEVGQHADILGLVAEVAAAERRLRVVADLAPLGVRVWGDDGWAHVVSRGVVHMGYAGHGRHLSEIYSSSAINLDIGRLYQLDIVTMRVFDVLACGGFLIAEHSEALVDLFDPGVHLETWTSTAELQDKIRFYQDRPALREQVAGRGRECVLELHTVRARVRSMFEDVAGFSVGAGALAGDGTSHRSGVSAQPGDDDVGVGTGRARDGYDFGFPASPLHPLVSPG